MFDIRNISNVNPRASRRRRGGGRHERRNRVLIVHPHKRRYHSGDAAAFEGIGMMLQNARALAEKGLAIFPCLPRDKRPATPHGLKDATTDLIEIENWWHQNPNYNIAIATGAASGVFVIDLDGADAEAELRKLEAQHHGKLPATVESITGRGRHLFFKCPEKQVRNSAGKIAIGIDVRANGGYVIVPPSIHPSGKRYCWSVDSAGTFAAAPEWLLSIVAEPENGTAALVSQWRELVCNDVAEGQRNSSAARLAGYLLRRFIDPIVALELVQSWNATRCSPPLPPEEIIAIVNSICGRELARRQG
jgi:bifunctional DNA primase/polymerase-like protein/primase-like protein